MEQALEVSTYDNDNQVGASTIDNNSGENGGGLRITPNDEAKSIVTDNEVVVTEDGAGEAQITADPPKKPDVIVDPPKDEKEAQATLVGVGLDIKEFENEYLANNALSEDSYKKLADAGIPKAVVDAYIDGQKVLGEKIVGDIYAIAGGEEQYRAMSAWVAENVPQEEVEAYNRVLMTNNKELISLAATGLVSRWKAAEGSAPVKLTQGRASATPKRGSAFESTEEMIKAMRDKRYGRDAAYTRAVEDKVARSNIFG